MAREFKVGDRVRLNASAERILPWCSRFFGKTLSVLAVDVVAVQVEDSEDGWFAFEWLELVAPAPALIDPAKTYQTRDGRAVRIYATDGGGAEPIHGAVQRNGEWYPLSWEPSGTFFSEGGEDQYDLIEVKPERDVWIAWRRSDNYNYFMTYSLKPTQSECPNAVAMKRVVIAEGEGIA